MSNQKTQSKHDIATLLENFRDLDDISKKIYQELQMKNKIIESGYLECQHCKKMIDKTGQKSVKKNSK